MCGGCDEIFIGEDRLEDSFPETKQAVLVELVHY